MNGIVCCCQPVRGHGRGRWRCVLLLFLLTLTLGPTGFADEPGEIAFETSDGGRIVGRLWGAGDHAVVLAHGAVFNKESWDHLAAVLAEHGLRVLAIDFRGYGDSRAGTAGRVLALDVQGAMAYLRMQGARRVSLVGGSMGGTAAAQAAIAAGPQQVDRLVLLAAGQVEAPRELPPQTLFLVSAGDGVRANVERQHAQAPEPKRLVVLAGDAHAQHLFSTPERDALTQHIVNWLTDETDESTATSGATP